MKYMCPQMCYNPRSLGLYITSSDTKLRSCTQHIRPIIMPYIIYCMMVTSPA